MRWAIPGKEVFEVSNFATNKYEDNGTEIVLDWIIRGFLSFLKLYIQLLKHFSILLFH
ncbi:MAG: hypothetical protein Ct9H90mP2_04980 [Dehalococcoidia bacterium]|nr:MAG: hypothetical protein Ct9H90mP2_04980 [Dehalococcoidia bacterium]